LTHWSLFMLSYLNSEHVVMEVNANPMKFPLKKQIEAKIHL